MRQIFSSAILFISQYLINRRILLLVIFYYSMIGFMYSQCDSIRENLFKHPYIDESKNHDLVQRLCISGLYLEASIEKDRNIKNDRWNKRNFYTFDLYDFSNIFHSTDALRYILDHAKSRIIIINDDEPQVYNRALVSSLLPGLRAKGYNHFLYYLSPISHDAASSKSDLMKLGCDDMSERNYAEMLREATKLGYHLFDYQCHFDTMDWLESNGKKLLHNSKDEGWMDVPLSLDVLSELQLDDKFGHMFRRMIYSASYLYQILNKDTASKIILFTRFHTGEKEYPYLGNVVKYVTGIEPYVIDQTSFSDRSDSCLDNDLYRKFCNVKTPSVYLTDKGKPFSDTFLLGVPVDLSVCLSKNITEEEIKAMQRQCNGVDLYVFNPKSYLADSTKWESYNGLRKKVSVKIDVVPDQQYYLYYKNEYESYNSCAIPVCVFNASSNTIQKDVYLFPANEYVIIGDNFKQDLKVN